MKAKFVGNFRKNFPLVALVFSFAAINLNASILATATFTDTQPVAGTFEYTLTLHNTGTTTIGTFWTSWIPGAGFMPVTPTNIQSPTGWNEILTNANGSIQWTTTTNLLAPGDTVSGFMFDSTMTPAQFLAPFPGPGLGAGDPISTSFVYIAAPLADPGAQLTITQAAATPEPSATILAGLGVGLFSFLKRRRLSY